jgi:hypothetical protein
LGEGWGEGKQKPVTEMVPVTGIVQCTKKNKTTTGLELTVVVRNQSV